MKKDNSNSLEMKCGCKVFNVHAKKVNDMLVDMVAWISRDS